MCRLARLVLISLIVTMVWPAALVHAENAESDITQEYWLGIYLKDKKIGNVHVKTEESVLDGKAVIRRERNWRIETDSDWSKVAGHITDVVYVTPAMEPLLIKVDGGQDLPEALKGGLSATLRFENNKCLMTGKGSDGKEMTFTNTLDEEDVEELVVGFAYDMAGRIPPTAYRANMGRFWMELTVNPPDLAFYFSVNRTAVLLVGPQQVEIGKNTYDTTVVIEYQTDDDGSTKILRRWLLKDGGIVKEEWQPSGITLMREPTEKDTSSDDTCLGTPPRAVDEQGISSDGRAA